MAEKPDKDSQTEEPTEKKIRDATAEGNVPSSREAGTLASFVAIFIAGSYFLAGNVVNLQNAMIRFIDNPGGWQLETSADVAALLRLIVTDAARVIVPVVLLLLLAGLGSSFLQNPPQLVGKRLKPEFSRLSLKKGWERLFGIRGLVEFGKALFKLIAVAVVGYLAVEASELEVLATLFMEPILIPSVLSDVLLRIVGWVALLTLALVVADIFWSRISWRKELRMTKQEVKDEHKQTEGNPEIKARIRSIGRDRARRRMMGAVPQATVVITNPTHYAVALRYVREEGGAPIVLAKGMNLIALKIREVAENHDIPIVEDKPLARSLYESVEVDKLIPPQFYKAVAEIIFYLHSRKTRTSPGGLKS
jgi:flagellar biosynthesis protein FlhB